MCSTQTWNYNRYTVYHTNSYIVLDIHWTRYLCKPNVSHGKKTKKLCNNKRNKISSTKAVSLIKLVWQHVSTSDGSLEASGMKHSVGTVCYIINFWNDSKLNSAAHSSFYVFYTTGLKMSLWGENILPN